MSTLERAVAALALLAGCASAQPIPMGDVAMRQIEGPRLERAVLDALAPRGIGLAAPRRVRIAGRREITAATCLGGTLHCIAVLGPSERERLRGFVPARPEDGALLSVPGAEADRGAQVLVFEADELRYQPDPARATEQEPSAQEIEDRVRRRVLDWVSWLAAQGALPR